MPSSSAPLNEPQDIPLPDRIQAGVDLLDRTKPGWHDEIDLDELNLRSPGNCVLGQLFNDFDNGRDTLRLSEDGAKRHGFICAYTDGGCECPALTPRWRERIETRRATAAKAGA